MGEVEKVQEKMKADMEATKEQMAAMMEAMMSLKKIIWLQLPLPALLLK